MALDILFDDFKKDLPSDELRRLFLSAGWSDGKETPEQQANFNIGFIHSTLVVSAWDDKRLVGAVRVLSDQIFRSILYDLIVDPEYQSQGIGSELIRRCKEHFPDLEWLVQTTEDVYRFYERNGFKRNRDVFLTLPSKLFTCNYD